MKKTLLTLGMAVSFMACQKNNQFQIEEQSAGLSRSGKKTSNTTSQTCSSVGISITNSAITVGNTSYYYPTNYLDLSSLTADANGNYILLYNCKENNPSPLQIAKQLKVDSLMNKVASSFSKLNVATSKLPSAIYSLPQFELAMDTTKYTGDGADYVSSIFNKIICSNPNIPKLPGGSAVLTSLVLSKHKNFEEITLEQAELYAARAEGFIIAIHTNPMDGQSDIFNFTGDSRMTVIDHRHPSGEGFKPDLVDRVWIRGEGDGSVGSAPIRYSNFFDIPSVVRFYAFSGYVEP
ncbi:hypothetical protein [Pedobacter frigoris]|uniref:hypothetical protein n=1 Tax=Pedobacter frigoris TaxID=2571272 RepID=UPI0029310E0F|nr:hypothetical protein [Pedobacter frigoris]